MHQYKFTKFEQVKNNMNHWLITAVFLFWCTPSEIFSQDQPSKATMHISSDPLPVPGRDNSSEFEGILNKAMNYQFTADSLTKLAESYRRQLKDNQNSDKTGLKTKISEAEKLAAVNQRLASDILGSGAQKQKDSVSQKNVKPKAEKTPQKSTDKYSLFEILPKSSVASDKIPVNPVVPAGLIYRIQIAVFKNAAAVSYFKGITPVFGFKSEGSDMTTYYAGMFRKMSDAARALTRVKALGFKDAFVVAILDKKIVSAERAGILEKEWGNRTVITDTLSGIVPRDTVPPTLIFRVEVTRSQKPLKQEQVEIIKRLAGNRGLDVIKNASEQNIYLIGKFLTFESAAEYADLLKRNGQKDAKVAAYLGMREIPVETAKQLFEKY
jgi:hypothetical protein